MATSRHFIERVVAALVLLFVFAAAGLTLYLYGELGDGQTCTIAPAGDPANDWLCFLVWAAAGVAMVSLLLLSIVSCGKLWYRGGIYKFLQLMTLLVPAILWAYLGAQVTINGLEANKESYDSTAQACRIALMVATILAAATLGLGVLLRAVEQPGHIQRHELDVIEAQRRAARQIAYLRDHNMLNPFLGTEDAVHHQLTVNELHATARKYSYGFLADTPDPTDSIYMPRHPRWYGQWLLPTRVDLSRAPFMPNVLNQGQLGTCVVHAATNAYRFALVKEARQSHAYMPSRLFIHYNAKKYLLKEPVEYDNGLYSRAAFKSVQLYGACDEHLWPYNNSSTMGQPSPEAYADANRRKHALKPIKLFVSNNIDPREKVYTIMAALSRGHPIACGLSLFGDELDKLGWKKPRCLWDKVLKYPTEQQLALKKHPSGSEQWGGHAVLLVGYDSRQGWFKFQNSWGADWCGDGYFYTGLAYIMNPELNRDFWMFNN